MVTRFASYAKEYDGGPLRVDEYFGYSDQAVANEWQRRSKRPVRDDRSQDIVTDEELAILGITAVRARTRHLAVVYRGTGGVIGQDLVSLVCQGAADLVEERNPNFPATMGGIPVGAATDLRGPSALKAAQIGLQAGKDEITAALRVNPRRGIVIGGYSWGAYVAAQLREWVQQTYPRNYVCSFSFGDPTRPVGGSYYRGAIPAGRGISSWRWGDPRDYQHCWLTHPGDMYADVPDGPTGDIMDTAFDMVVGTQLTDPAATAKAILLNIPIILKEAGIDIPDILKGLAVGGGPGLAHVLLPFLADMLPGLLGGGTPTGPAAAVQAAVIGLRFLAAGTGPHIRYHLDEIWPGQTYLGLAIQHVRDWATRTPALAA
jgi:hypothetical protein